VKNLFLDTDCVSPTRVIAHTHGGEATLSDDTTVVRQNTDFKPKWRFEHTARICKRTLPIVCSFPVINAEFWTASCSHSITLSVLSPSSTQVTPPAIHRMCTKKRQNDAILAAPRSFAGNGIYLDVTPSGLTSDSRCHTTVADEPVCCINVLQSFACFTLSTIRTGYLA
jgi:hypothetical protein